MSKTRNPDALIRIEDAIKVLCREKCYPGSFCPDSYCSEMWDEFEDVERVNAIPVRHGHWVRWHEEAYDSFGVAYIPHCKCSECGMECDPYIANHMNYCFNCGARFDGTDGDTDGV